VRRVSDSAGLLRFGMNTQTGAVLICQPFSQQT
jgi:hypothetical protein